MLDHAQLLELHHWVMDLDAPVRRVAAADCHLTYNTAEQAAILPSAADVAAVARELSRF